jgi:hypothetical protein
MTLCRRSTVLQSRLQYLLWNCGGVVAQVDGYLAFHRRGHYPQVCISIAGTLWVHLQRRGEYFS